MVISSRLRLLVPVTTLAMTAAFLAAITAPAHSDPQADDTPVLVIASGINRVDEKKVAAQVGELARADARFVKEKTGYSIGGVSPIGHVVAPVTLIDEDLLKLASLWAAAGHPHAVFNLTPQQLVAMTGAPVVDVALRS